MDPIVVRGVKIGDGIPKICVPIAENSFENIVKVAKQILDAPANLVEWRADCFESVFDFNKTREVLECLRDILSDMPILFTMRSLQEGGKNDIDVEAYVELNKKVLDTGLVDLIDIEVLNHKTVAKELVDYAHKASAKVIASHHDFKKTPDKELLIWKLQSMREFGADVVKIAVMPKTSEDVELLLAVTERMKEHIAAPIVAIAMSDIGLKSRYTSEITFGTVGKASAPGQISACELEKKIRL